MSLLITALKQGPINASDLCVRADMNTKQTDRSRAFVEALRAAGHVYIHSWAAVNQPLYHWRTSLNQVDAPRPNKAGKKGVSIAKQCAQALQTHGRLGVRDMQHHVRAPLIELSSTLSRMNARGEIHRVAWERLPNANGALHPSGVYEYGPGVTVPKPGTPNSVFDVAPA